GRKRAPNLRSSDRIVAGLCTLLMRRIRVLRSAIVLKPATLLNFHKMLVKQKYRLLFSLKRVRKPGPKGPTKELIDAVVDFRNGRMDGESLSTPANENERWQTQSFRMESGLERTAQLGNGAQYLPEWHLARLTGSTPE